MIEQIILEDFQVHKRRVLKLSPTVTTLVGDNHSGKSACVRGLRFLCLNKLNRKAAKYIRFGKKSLKITVVVDGHVITRSAGRVNQYTLDGKVFSAVGRKPIPPEIEELINVSPLNFQTQLDGPFWFGDTAGDVAKKLNEIVNLTSIDRTLATVKSLLTKTTSEVELTKSRLSEAQARKDQLAWVPDFLADVERLRTLQKSARKTRQAARKLRFIARKVSSAANLNKTLTRALRDADSVIKKGRAAQDKDREAARLEEAIMALDAALLEAKMDVPDMARLEKVKKWADGVAGKASRLDYLIRDCEKHQQEAIRCERAVAELEAEMQKKARLCKLCGQPIVSRSSRPTGTSATKPHSHAARKKRTTG